MTIHERIKERRKALGLTAEYVANALGVSRATIYRYESSDIEKLPTDTLEPLCRVLHTTPSYIMGWEDSNDPNIHPYNPTHRIPILGRVAAGLPIYAEEHIEGYTYTELNHGGEYFALRVVGDSMTALHIIPGCLVIVRKQEVAENGAIAVVLVDEEDATVKKYRRDGNTVTLYPQSLNSSHEPQTYNLKAHRIRILGIIVKVELSIDVL
jgi:SOS-response transcriptional repressors (RecA-mediated autopeptidases)